MYSGQRGSKTGSAQRPSSTVDLTASRLSTWTQPPPISLSLSLNTERLLDVSFNDLTALPPDLARCSALVALNLAANPLGPGLPAAVCELSALTELNVDHTGG